MEILILLLQIYFGFMFLVAGIAKFRDSSYFKPINTLLITNLISPKVIRSFSILEILMGFWLFSGVKAIHASIISILLLIVFLIVHLRNWFDPQHINCGCFGYSKEKEKKSVAIIVAVIRILMGLTMYFGIVNNKNHFPYREAFTIIPALYVYCNCFYNKKSLEVSSK